MACVLAGPGAILQSKGNATPIIDERASPRLREALLRRAHVCLLGDPDGQHAAAVGYPVEWRNCYDEQLRIRPR